MESLVQKENFKNAWIFDEIVVQCYRYSYILVGFGAESFSFSIYVNPFLKFNLFPPFLSHEKKEKVIDFNLEAVIRNKSSEILL